MADETANLSLPLMQAAQAQKHVTHNAALEVLDLVAQLRVQTFDTVTPPASPNEGQIWALGDTPTGAWAGQDGKLAAWSGGGWLFVAPQKGWRAFDMADAVLRVYRATATGPAWMPVSPEQATIDTLPRLGVNATADSVNRLSVASDATLLNHAGADHQLKLNKATPAATASLLYQTGFSGRAEMGLTGTDDFAIKVSPNGSTFVTALRINAATGEVALPATRTRQLIAYNYRHYIYDTRRWSAPTASASSTNAAQNLGSDTEPSLDWDSKGIFVPAGSLLRGFMVAGSVNGAEITNLDVGVYFQHGPWNDGWTSPAGTVRSTLPRTPASPMLRARAGSGCR